MNNIFPKVGDSKTLSQKVEMKIEEAIRERKLLPGDKLPTEKELCEMFEVSRTALREALQMLSARGLVNIRKGSGIYVANFTKERAIKPMSLFLELNLNEKLIRDVMELRKIIEPSLAALAAQNRSENDLAEIIKTISDLKTCSEKDTEKEAKIDANFHMCIARASGNPLAPMILEPIYRLMPKIRTLIYQKVPHAKEKAIQYHELLFEKIVNKNSKSAREIMQDHLSIADQDNEDLIHVIKQH
ncbi:MAG: FadR/GntR family transcriptional regulator [Candidatus Marinimicrobia bacterium]|nr:FadR/GntR family transcriptional regulator [Candidatus Neomarinimicrobiota bacterium]